ncbi:hypothetical protein RQP46_009077 [Phenoliferia psychrophenolica]
MSALASLIPLNKVLGSLLVGSWMNGILLVNETMQVWKYFEHHQGRDSVVVRVSVAAAVGFSVFTATTGFTSAIVQIFLAHRACRLIPNPKAKVATNAVLVSMTLSGMACVCWVLSVLVRYPSYLDRDKFYTPAMLSLIMTFVTDIAVTGVFLSQMWRLRQKYLANGLETGLGGVITRLSYGAIETGAVSVAVAVALLILILNRHDPNSNCSMLFNLNARGGKEHVYADGNGATVGGRFIKSKPTTGNQYTLPISRVHVSHEQTVHVDDPANSFHLGVLRVSAPADFPPLLL